MAQNARQAAALEGRGLPPSRELPLKRSPLALAARWPLCFCFSSSELTLLDLSDGAVKQSLHYPPFAQDGVDAISAYTRLFLDGRRTAAPPPPLVVAMSACGVNAMLAVGGWVCRVPLLPAPQLLQHVARLQALSLLPSVADATATEKQVPLDQAADPDPPILQKLH